MNPKHATFLAYLHSSCTINTLAHNSIPQYIDLYSENADINILSDTEPLCGTNMTTNTAINTEPAHTTTTVNSCSINNSFSDGYHTDIDYDSDNSDNSDNSDINPDDPINPDTFGDAYPDTFNLQLINNINTASPDPPTLGALQIDLLLPQNLEGNKPTVQLLLHFLQH